MNNELSVHTWIKENPSVHWTLAALLRDYPNMQIQFVDHSDAQAVGIDPCTLAVRKTNSGTPSWVVLPDGTLENVT